MKLHDRRIISILTEGLETPADKAKAVQKYIDANDETINALHQFVNMVKQETVGDADVLVADQFFIRKEKIDGERNVTILDANGSEILTTPNKVLRKLNRKKMLPDIIPELVEGLSESDLNTLITALEGKYTPQDKE